MIQLIKISNQSYKILGNYAECRFVNLIQTTNFYTQDLFQLIFLINMRHQIT